MITFPITFICCVVLMFSIGFTNAQIQDLPLKTDHVGAENPKFSRGACPTSSNGYLYGWHFILRGRETVFLKINCTFKYAKTVTEMVNHPSNKHAYVFTPTPDTLLGAVARVNGSGREIILSHICYPDTTSPTSTSKSKA